MIFEHFALNVTDVRAQALWYVEHLGFSVLRKLEASPYTHFLADSTGRAIIELYTNPSAPVSDFSAMLPLTFHFALVSADARADRTRLAEAGASVVKEEALPDGGLLIMMRDPWSIPLQLCQRIRPLSPA